jgi:hypothetical protein
MSKSKSGTVGVGQAPGRFKEFAQQQPAVAAACDAIGFPRLMAARGWIEDVLGR